MATAEDISHRPQFRKVLASPGSATVLSSALVTGCTVITGVLTARILDVAERGLYSSALALCSVLSLVSIAGAAEALVLGPRRNIDKDAVQTVSWSYSVLLSLGSTLPVVLYMWHLGMRAPHLLALAAILPILGSIGPLMNFSLVGESRFIAAAVLRVSPILIQIVMIVVVIVSGSTSLATVLAASAIGSLGAVMIGAALARPWRHFGRVHDFAVVRSVMTIGLHTGGTQILRAASSRMDLILISIFLTALDAGLYAVASSMTVAGLSVVASLSPVLLARARDDSVRLTAVASTMAFCVGGAILVVGPVLLPLVYGSEYESAKSLIYSLVAAMVANSVFELMVRTMQQDMNERTALAAVSIAAVSQLILVSGACILLDIYWVAVGSATAYIIGIAFLLVVNRRNGGDSLLRHVSPWSGLRAIAMLVIPRCRSVVTSGRHRRRPRSRLMQSKDSSGK